MSEEKKPLETEKNQQELKHRPIKSFVIRSGRMTLGQQKGWQECWPKLGLELGETSNDIREAFVKQQPLVVEIGFGMGSSLAEMSLSVPDLNFLGIEVHRPGVGALMALVKEHSLENIKLFCADANEVLKEHIADNSIYRLQLYFPDPWHKVRHNKRRLVQSGFVQTIRPKLEIGGVFHMATDWEPYAKHMMKVMESAEGFRNISGEQQYAEHPDFRPYTKFEKRGQDLGHGVWDLMFERLS
jgi:tRNA (guanine-N7-)-methyltransferase